MTSVNKFFMKTVTKISKFIVYYRGTAKHFSRKVQCYLLIWYIEVHKNFLAQAVKEIFHHALWYNFIKANYQKKYITQSSVMYFFLLSQEKAQVYQRPIISC